MAHGAPRQETLGGFPRWASADLGSDHPAAEPCCDPTGGDKHFVGRALAQPAQLLWERGAGSQPAPVSTVPWGWGLEMPRKSHVLVLAMAQPAGRAPWHCCSQKRGPTTYSPSPTCPPISEQIPSHLGLQRDNGLQTQSISSGNWDRPGCNSIAPNSQRFPPLGLISSNSEVPWTCLIQAPEVLPFLQHSPAPKSFLCQSCH